jgi:predicted nucleic acid binding AN1-type Zn finger protein
MEGLKENTKSIQVELDRCFSCSRRVGPVKFLCRCGYSFCSKHRLSEEHACSFDHSQDGRRRLAQDNPQVVAEKVAKI